MMSRISNIFIISILFLNSCSYEKYEEDSIIPNESISLRITIQAIKKINQLNTIKITDIQDKMMVNSSLELCFNFNYPINIVYKDNSTINVTSFSQLIQLILNESQENHMSQIKYPFSVIMASNNQEVSILNESAFENLIEECGYFTLAFSEIKEAYIDCFDFNYPVSVFINGNQYNFNDESDAVNLAATFNQEVNSFNFVYPFSIKKQNNPNINIPDYYTMTTVIASCN
tara:strand:+ start:248 stop:937 length:690 start_codon:yes stop_codon:yes gene_type:complete